jgi:glutathionylspermidine synthase
MREQAIAEYHSLLATDETLDPEFFSHLKERMKANLLSYGERALGVALRPHLLMRAQYDRLAEASQILAGAFDKVAAAMLADPPLLDHVGLLEREQSLALIDPGFSFPAVTTRLDAFVHGDEVKFVEYNAENPSSLTDQEGLNQVLFEVRALQSLAERYRLHQFAPADALLQSLLDTYHEWGGHGAPNIAILDWADLPTANEFALLRNHFVGHSVPTIICTPDELEYSGGTLRRDDFRVDLVYKRIVIHEYLERYDESHPLVRAYTNKDVCLVNPFRCKIVHKKACFELLTDETRASWFTPGEREVISRCVPWTRRVSERKTSRNGQAIDLIEHIRTNRTDFILKPNDDYGGIGIFLGHRSTEGEWDTMLSTALESDYVVQEIIELHTEEFPIFNEEGWSIQPVFVDTNPFIFRGRVHGAMVRLSDSPIVNVTSGGGETGFFVLEGSVDP